MRFLAYFAKDLNDEFEDLTAFYFQASSWIEAAKKVEEHAAKINMQIDSLNSQA